MTVWFILTRFAPLIRGVASVFSASRGVVLAKIKTPRSPSANDPLVRGSKQRRK
jgi:hypothetical protein